MFRGARMRVVCVCVCVCVGGGACMCVRRVFTETSPSPTHGARAFRSPKGSTCTHKRTCNAGRRARARRGGGRPTGTPIHPRKNVVPRLHFPTPSRGGGGDGGTRVLFRAVLHDHRHCRGGGGDGGTRVIFRAVLHDHRHCRGGEDLQEGGGPVGRGDGGEGILGGGPLLFGRGPEAADPPVGEAQARHQRRPVVTVVGRRRPRRGGEPQGWKRRVYS